MSHIYTIRTESVVKYSKSIVLLAVMVLAIVFLPHAYAAPVSVTITPSTQAISQLSVASFAIGLSGAAKNAYRLSLSGLAYGSTFSFSSNPVSTPPGGGTGSGSSTLNIDTSSTPMYCPGTYSFTVSATNSTSAPTPGAPGDSSSASATLSVIPIGPPLSVTVTTDKSTYRIGDKATIVLTVNRPAEGTLTITSPGGAPSQFFYTFLGPTSSITKTLTVSTIGRWNVNFQADDFCSGFSSGQAPFDVTPDTYDISISLNGVPAQFSAQLNVDGQSQGSIGGTEIKSLSFKLDTSHTLTVDQYIQGDSGSRFFASQNTWTVNAAGSHTFQYTAQYLLTVSTDPAGVTDVSGGGWYDAGSSAQTSQVPSTVPGPAGTQYAFKGWTVDGAAQSGNGISVTMDKAHTAVATYETDYQLLIDSPYGNPQGQGYYAAGSTATFSVSTPWGFPIQQVFTQWQGDYTGTSPQGSVTMDKPKVIHAVWSTSYIPLIAIAVVAIAVVGGVLFWRMKRGPGSSASAQTKLAVGEGGEAAGEAAVAAESAKCSKCGTENSLDQKFCTNCGEKLSHHKKHQT